MKNKRTVKKTEGGFIALTSVLIIGAIVLVLGVSLFHSSLTDYSTSTAFESGQEAAFLADFCLKEGILKLEENIDYRGGEEIEVNNMSCSIGPVEDIPPNTKKISSLGRAGEELHFSRASQLIRYVIEPAGGDWNEAGGNLENLEIVNNSLKLISSEDTEIRTEDWGNYFYFDEENLKIEDGSLMLQTEEPPPGEPAGTFSCDNVTASSINIEYEFSNTSDVRLYRELAEIAKLGSGTKSGTFIDTGDDIGGLSYNTSYTYTLKDGENILFWKVCTTTKNANGSTCDVNEDCLSDNCQNNVCCIFGETCCSSDNHCPPDSCDSACKEINNYCDVTTDYYCKSEANDCAANETCSDTSCTIGITGCGGECTKCSSGSCVPQSSSEDIFDECGESCPTTSTLNNYLDGGVSCSTVCSRITKEGNNCKGGEATCGSAPCICQDIGTDGGDSGWNKYYSYYDSKYSTCARSLGGCSTAMSLQSGNHWCSDSGHGSWTRWTYCKCK